MIRPAANPSSERVLVLLADGGADDAEAQLMRFALSDAGISLFHCGDLEDFAREVEAGVGAAIIDEDVLTPEGLIRVKEILREQPRWSDLPLLVLDSGPTGLGAYLAGEISCVTLIDRPIRAPSLVSAVAGALRGRRRQYEQRDLLQDAERVRRRRDEFLAMLGHELRNPLGAISAAVQVLNRVESSSAEASEMREMIERQAAHLTRLVDDLLDVSRVHSGRISLQREPVDLNELARQCLHACEGIIAAQRHGVTFEPADQPVIVEADAVRIEQVISNLLTNAIKYTPAGGKIRLSVHREAGNGRSADYAVVRVSDTGIGIDADMLVQVFEMFAQGDRTLDRSLGGVGLGLTLVRRLVEMHGGTVTARSEGSGRGSTFEVRLPAIRRSESETAASAAIPGGFPARGVVSSRRDDARYLGMHASSHPRRILIIEDGPDARRALGRLLEIWGHRVELAEEGTGGVERAIAIRPDVALIDIGLPGMNGYEVARRVRQVLGRNIHLIALTGYGQPDDHERTRAAGFDQHLVKPVNPAILSRLLDEADSHAGR